MTVTDFHSHILPGIDDGSRSVGMSLAMLEMLSDQGIRDVVATPHFYPNRDDLGRFLEAREKSFARLSEEMTDKNHLPEVHLGAEVYFFRGMHQSDALDDLTIASKSCILIEMPLAPWTEEMYRELEQIQTQRGLIPIVAHIDRYIRPFRTYGIPRRLAQLPVLVQANAAFFLRRATATMALRMLKREQIHLLGSDCHDLESRKPNLGLALEQIKQKLGEDALQKIETCERSVLHT